MEGHKYEYFLFVAILRFYIEHALWTLEVYE